jgi:hypothetical protein
MSNGRHGFAICVYPASVKYPSGTKSWFFIYQYDGKKYTLRLGKYPTMGLYMSERGIKKATESGAVALAKKREKIEKHKARIQQLRNKPRT